MRMHFNKIFTAMMLSLALASVGMPAMAAETEPVVETITLDEDMYWDSDIPSDISWRTKQDKGKWIEDLGIAKDATSLILVINNLDKDDPDAIPNVSDSTQTEKSKEERKKEIVEQNRLNGKSQLSYFTKVGEEGWQEVFSVECYISGGQMMDKEEIYGAYEPAKTFGIRENPGSLLPFRSLTSNEYWILDPEDENYGSIYIADKYHERPANGISLEGLKAFVNYGMILQPEDDYADCPALVINCLQSETNSDVLSGIQMPEDYLRMLIQSIDSDTRVVIAGEMGDIEGM